MSEVVAKKMIRFILINAITLLVTFQSVFISLLATPVRAAEATDVDQLWEEALQREQVNQPDITYNLLFDDWEDLSWIYGNSGTIVLNSLDRSKVAEGQVDYRVTQYLVNLVTPTEHGGQGINHIKVERIFKNFSTQTGTGRFERENLAAIEEDNQLLSAHNTGQAVDISEVGTVTCKLVERRHLGGDKTRWQRPTPVKVAWQSREGISRNPTPKGRSLLGIAGDQSAQAILRYLNDSGELDYYVNYVRGLDLKTILSYVGMNVILKTFHDGDITSDPLANSVLETLGTMVVNSAFPTISKGIATSAEPDDDLQLATAKSQSGEAIGLPSGSLRSPGWFEILKNTGKRHIEQNLGLPTNYFEGKSFNQAINTETLQGALQFAAKKDESLEAISGTYDMLMVDSDKGFRFAGVKIISDALKLTDQQRSVLELAVRSGENPNINISNQPVDSKVPGTTLQGYFSPNEEEQRRAEANMRQIGGEILRQVIAKDVPKEYREIANQIRSSVTTGKSINVKDLLKSAGAKRISSEVGLNERDSRSLVDTPSRTAVRLISEHLNKNFGLEKEDRKIEPEDIDAFFSRDMVHTDKVIDIIAGHQADKAIGWVPGTGYKLLTDKISVSQAFLEAAGNIALGAIGFGIKGVSFEGDIPTNIGQAIIESKLGIKRGSFKNNPDAIELKREIGGDNFRRVFKVSNPTDADNADRDLVRRLNVIDSTLGVHAGTIQDYLSGRIIGSELSHMVGMQNALSLTVSNLWNEFGLDDATKLKDEEGELLIRFLSGTTRSFEERNSGIGVLQKLIGRSVGIKAGGFDVDALYKYFKAESGQERVDIFLNQGVKMMIRSIGVLNEKINNEQLEEIAGIVVEILKDPRGFYKENVEGDRENAENNENNQENAENNENNQENAENAESPQEKATRQAQSYAHQRAKNFITESLDIPENRLMDSSAIFRGDSALALSAMSFKFIITEYNKYLPEKYHLTYEDLRNTVRFSDTDAVNKRYQELKNEEFNYSLDQQTGDGLEFDFNYQAPPTSNFNDATLDYSLNQPSPENSGITLPRTQAERESLERRNKATREAARAAQNKVKYLMSDALLRKSDPSIPVGFSHAMFEGTMKDRLEMLETWVYTKIDIELLGIDPSYAKGSLRQLMKGELTRLDSDILYARLIEMSGVSIGSFDAQFLKNLFTFARSENRDDFLTHQRYNGMWNYFDNWLESQLNLGLPRGFVRSLYNYFESGWDVRAQIIDSNGKVVAPSLEVIGENFIVERVSKWADKQFNLPIGSAFRAYQAIRGVVDASRLYHIAKLSGDAAKVTQASTNLSQAQASLTVFVITTALSMCEACQEIFADIDRAIAAPPGFTNMAAAGLISMAFGLGPAGLFMAGAVYLFGVHRVDFLCPKPPREMFALNGFDKEHDQLEKKSENKKEDLIRGIIGTPKKTDIFSDVKNPNDVSSSPRAGENPFDWDDNIPFIDGNKSEIWMAWSRFHTGRLLDATVRYSSSQETVNKPVQILTFRQANVEHFASYRESTFGPGELNNPRVGMGFTQDSTKTTDWVHVAFGGFL